LTWGKDQRRQRKLPRGRPYKKGREGTAEVMRINVIPGT